LSRKYPNLVYQRGNFENTISAPKKNYYDVLWCHDAFQYAVNPIQTLSAWYDIASEGAMLTIILPQTTNIRQHKLSFVQHHGCFYHYTLVNLIHMLAISGWDCNKGFFLKRPTDPWIHAVVYKSQHRPQDPRTANWHKLSEMGLLPESADKGIYARGALHQEDLVLPWLDHSLTWYGQQ
jgi:hypothetical protein